MNKKLNVRMLTEGGMMIALATILSHFKVYEAPNGGSVTAGSMIPIILFAIRWGMAPGIAIGTTYGILQFILKPEFYYPMQVVLDYPVAFGLLGLAGIVSFLKNDESIHGYINVFIGVLLAIIGRMGSHVLSVAIFFAEYAGSKNPWIYSLGYNATYLIPELIISSIILVLLWKPLKRAKNI